MIVITVMNLQFILLTSLFKSFFSMVVKNELRSHMIVEKV
jgi:hypothetical protein